MRAIFFVSLKFAVLLGLIVAALATTLWTASAAQLSVMDVNGATHSVPNAKRRATVLFFVAHDCPISNSYAPEINRIYAEYSARNVAFYMVYPEPDLTKTKARQHAHEFGYRCPALLDSGHRLVKRTGATVTPEVAILSSSGKLLYRGRIDDRHIDFGKKRLQPTRRDLRLALDAIIHGKPVSNRLTKAVGCFIPAGD
jgi:hypothetical protein